MTYLLEGKDGAIAHERTLDDLWRAFIACPLEDGHAVYLIREFGGDVLGTASVTLHSADDMTGSCYWHVPCEGEGPVLVFIRYIEGGDAIEVERRHANGRPIERTGSPAEHDWD